MNDETTGSIETNENPAANEARSKCHNTAIEKNIDIAKSTTTATTVPPVTTNEITTATKNELLLKNLGRNARERLQKERSKRRFIQRISIDDNIEPPQMNDCGINNMVQTKPTRTRQHPSKTSSGPNENSALVEAVVVERKRKLTTKKAPVAATRTKQRRNVNGNRHSDSGILIDRWVPDVSHICHNTNQNSNENIEEPMEGTSSVIPAQCSDTVQLHGLPINTTVQQIRTFFTGLPIQRMLLLLPYPTTLDHGTEKTLKFHVTDFDAKFDDRDILDRGHNSTNVRRSNSDNHHHKFRMERYDSNMVRLFVQFPSFSIATLAQQRSGEVIYGRLQPPGNKRKQSPTDVDDDDDEDKVGAAIAITIVPQRVAVFMTKLLAIDILLDNPTRNSTTSSTLEQILEPLIQRIDPQISMTLWEAVIDELSLKAEVPRTKRKRPASCLRMSISNVEWSELQNEKLQLQQEIDRIIHVSSSSDDNHWNKVLLFLLSTSGTNNNNISNNHHHQPDTTKFVCMLNDRWQHPPNNDPIIIHWTREYIQLLQLYQHRIETMMTIHHRQKILLGESQQKV